MKTVSFTPPPLGFGFKNITSGYIVRGKKVGGRDGNKWGQVSILFPCESPEVSNFCDFDPIRCRRG